MERRNVWLDIIFWTALIVLAFWIILKSFGYIDTLAFVEAIPYISGIFIAGTIWPQFRYMQQDLSVIKRNSSRFLKVAHEHNLVMEGKMKHN